MSSMTSNPEVNEPELPEVEVDLDFCSRCKDHAVFRRYEDGMVLSDCCSAPPVDTDPYDLRKD